MTATPQTRVFQNCISLANSGSVGTAFYEPYDFVASDHVTHLKRENSSKELYLSLTTVLQKQKGNFSFSREINDARIQALKIMLPVTDSDEPDYNYMSDYVKEKKETLLAKYRAYVEKQIAELGNYVEIPSLEDKDWEGVSFESLFQTVKRGDTTNVPTGALLEKTKLKHGKTPRITATSSQNGIGLFHSTTNISCRESNNFISLSFLGDAFYQPYRATLDMKIHALKFKDRIMNPWVGLFTSTMIKHNTSWVTYGNQLSSKDAVSKKVLLPIAGSGKPDFEYMEQYAKNMMLKKYKQYLAFIDNKEKSKE